MTPNQIAHTLKLLFHYIRIYSRVNDTYAILSRVILYLEWNRYFEAYI